MRRHAHHDFYDERVAQIAERARGLQPHLPDDDEDPLPRFDEMSDRNKVALVAEYTGKFGPGWVDDVFTDIKRDELLKAFDDAFAIDREQLIGAYSQGRDAFTKLLTESFARGPLPTLLRAAFERYAGSVIDRAINNGEIDV